jgi:osmoprotectant transport system permease protein
VLIYRSPWGSALGNTFTSVGLTIPSYALLGVLVAVIGIGVLPSVIMLVFFGFLPILRNVLVGLGGVDRTLVESARGMGMSRVSTLLRLEIPLAWPVIMTGVRVSAQMLMGVAAIAAYALGPGLGGYIFSGISRTGGANATNSIVAGTVGILILAVILDTVLNIVTRLTTPRGIRV